MSLLEAKDICKSYHGVPVIRDVSLRVERGEIVSLLGVSGVGKSTLFHVLSGVSSPDSGRVLLRGEDITGKTGRISYMQQKDLLLPFKTVLDNVCLPLVIRGERLGDARRRAAGYFEQFGLAGTGHRYPGSLSGGMRQRAALLRTYLFESEMLLLDEPFSALDAITRGQMQQWYLEVLGALGVSALLITHDIDEAVYLSDRIYVMRGVPGRIAGELFPGGEGRKNKDFVTSEKFLVYKREILDILKTG